MYYLTSFSGSSCSCGSCTQYGSWYTADRQREGWGCGTRLQICAGGTCVVAAITDFGPGCSVDNRAGGPVLDASPNVCSTLFGTTSCGWSDRKSVQVSVVPSSTPFGPSGGGVPSVPSAPSGGNGNSNNPPATTTCSFRNLPGACTTQAQCAGVWTSSNNGASGCESLPANVRCCTASPGASNSNSNGDSNGNSGNSGSSSGSSSSSSNGGTPLISGGPLCMFQSARGACVSTSSCRAQNGLSFPYRRGAIGCESFGADVQCCVPTSAMLVGEEGETNTGTSSGLSVGAVAGIVVAAVVVAVALVVVVAYFVLRRHYGNYSDGFVVTNSAVYAPTTPSGDVVGVASARPADQQFFSTRSARVGDDAAALDMLEAPLPTATAAATAAPPSPTLSTRSSLGQYACVVCGKSYAHAEDLQMHAATRH